MRILTISYILKKKAPNFAFALAARKFNESKQQDLHSFDLSSLEHMINAAEPVDFNAIAAFYRVNEINIYFLYIFMSHVCKCLLLRMSCMHVCMQ